MPAVPLAARLLLAFALLAIASTASVGLLVRDAWRTAENERFDAQVEGARAGIEVELASERAAIHDLLRPICEYDAFVDKTLIDMQAGRLDSSRRLALAELVPDEMKALRLDELILVTGRGEVLGAGHDPALVGVTDKLYARQLVTGDKDFGAVRPPSVAKGKTLPAALVAHCVRKSGAEQVGLVGARHLSQLLDRMSKAYAVRIAIAGTAQAHPASDEITHEVLVDRESGLRVVVAKSKQPLEQALARLDQVMLVAGGMTLAIAILLAVVLARSLAKPLSQLATEVREVVDGQPHAVTVRGTREMRQLAEAFNRTLHDLAVLRRRQAAVERIAAWREVARRVAHEIKNPLTPIRSSIETLRRLRERNDPKFDEYFADATKGILDDVHRIATIASEFGKFARLPPPRPAPTDVTDLARTVVSMHTSDAIPIELDAHPVPEIHADRDQLAQMLTNLVQNAMDAVRDKAGPSVVVSIHQAGPDHIAIVIQDNGPGVSDELVPRLFEPYLTTKPHGTGLGLPIVQRIVLEHAGEIEYSRAPKGGACFRVLLPIEGPAVASDPRPES